MDIVIEAAKVGAAVGLGWLVRDYTDAPEGVSQRAWLRAKHWWWKRAHARTAR